MKTRCLIIALCLLYMISCTNDTIHKFPSMIKAERIMDEYPDSARVLLANMKDKMNIENEATRMYYNLLTVKADYKSERKFTSDSLMKRLDRKLDVERENVQLKVKAAHQERTIFLFIIVFVVTGIVVLLFVMKRRAQAKGQRELLNKIMKQQQHTDVELKENALRIMELEGQLSSSRQQSDEMQAKLLLSEKTWLEKRNSQIEAKEERLALYVESMKQSDIYMNFYRKGERRQRATDEEFDALEKVVNLAYNGFTNRLRQLRPSITQKELRTCLLTKIGLSQKDIAFILCLCLSGIGMIRSRLYKKIFGKEGTTEDFDAFVGKM